MNELRVLIEETVSRAMTKVAVPSVRPGTVASAMGPMVLIDGDDVAVEVPSIVGPVGVGDRVMVLFHPPAGALVLGVLDPPPVPWISMVTTAPWTATNPFGFQAPQYRKIGDIVYLRGLTTAGTPAATTIATLPVGYRPPINVMFTQWMSWAGGTGLAAVRLDVSSAGLITHAAAAYSLPSGTTSPAWVTADHLAFDGMSFSVTA